MSRIILVPFAAFVLFAGCNSKKQVMEKPDNLINRITLVNILADSYLIESTLQIIPNDTITKDELARQYYKDLFERVFYGRISVAAERVKGIKERVDVLKQSGIECCENLENLSHGNILLGKIVF